MSRRCTISSMGIATSWPMHHLGEVMVGGEWVESEEEVGGVSGDDDGEGAGGG
jgi:hypothetical protein